MTPENNQIRPQSSSLAPSVQASRVAVPASLAAATGALRTLTSTITQDDVAAVADMLGVFEGSLDLEKFRTYAGGSKQKSAATVPVVPVPTIDEAKPKEGGFKLPFFHKKMTVNVTEPTPVIVAPMPAEPVVALEPIVTPIIATPDPAPVEPPVIQEVPAEIAVVPDIVQPPAIVVETAPEPMISVLQTMDMTPSVEVPQEPAPLKELSWFARRRLAKEQAKAQKEAAKQAALAEKAEKEPSKLRMWAWKRRRRKEEKQAQAVQESVASAPAIPLAQVAVAPVAAAPARVSEAVLREQVANEGFLEAVEQTPGMPGATTPQPVMPAGATSLPTTEAAPVADDGIVSLGGGVMQPQPVQPLVSDTDVLNQAEEAGLTKSEIRALKRQLKQQQKQIEEEAKKKEKYQKQQEEDWKEEADRRQKLLKEKKEKHKGGAKVDAADVRAQMRAKSPSQRKQSGVQKFLNSLNYMGMEKDRVAFIDNLGTMMEAGLPLLDAVRSLQRETKNKQMKKIINQMIVAIEMGSPLWRSMDAQYFFRPQQIAMVRVGEEAGNLVENLHYLSEQERKDRDLRGKVKTAMIYPIIILVMLTVIIFGLGIFVLPNLIQVIFSLGVPLPFVTRMIVKFTNLFTEQGTTIIPAFLGGVLFFVLITKYTSFRIVVQWVLFKIPGIGSLIREATLSRFGVIMGGLLRAGVPVTDALESLANVTSLARYKKFYYQLLERVRLGDSFATSFRKIKLTDKCFPPSLQQLVVTGEQSGSLTKIMLKSAEIHDRRASDIAEKLPVILEPMLLLFIGCLVGTIALGILAPIYSVVGNVGQ